MKQGIVTAAETRRILIYPLVEAWVFHTEIKPLHKADICK